MKVAIVGYGNLGRGVENALKFCDDMELVGVFTRREPSTLNTNGAKAYSIDDIFSHDIDVCILCGGSATDLQKQSPMIAKKFNVVDSFDTHANIPTHLDNLEEVCTEAGTLSMISSGWDPGLFSVARLIGETAIVNGETFTFWGKGVSQGHGDAIRRVEGVCNAVQYTIPKDEALRRVREEENVELSTGDKHIRECFVVAKEGADKDKIAEDIKTMPNYFSDYETIVHFISAEELEENHSGMPHGGHVIRKGYTSEGVKQILDFGLALDSNPEFTAAVNVACARAVYRSYKEGRRGCITMFDIPLAYLSPLDRKTLIKNIL